ncbi:hypothetical protein A3B39_03180 [Candidatus Daviesbacteria bacterium RIFCSPLOWO2_01_FULL_37_10]|nr:MAG: hypothetical protein A2111_02835 [Candidatus Daviesbacteria bacterium GWA1_38_6]OGE44787.1 MAG: hypothetical protein A3B39_03180 [Candidatus Daviesbacteria bacterium RIFCSPLOWO2_01_FULL_37_10]
MKIKLTKHQWERSSEITSNLGTVAIVAFVIPYFSSEVDQIKAISGLVMAFGLWYIGIILARKY